MSYLGASPDFDQASIIGVDFGANYNEDFGIVPTELKGKYMNNYDDVDYDQDLHNQNIDDEYSQQLGCNSPDFGSIPQMGEIPSGLSPYFGEIPSGMSAFNGPKPYAPNGQGLGGVMDTLKNPLFTVAGMSVTPIHLALIAAAGAGYWYFKMRK